MFLYICGAFGDSWESRPGDKRLSLVLFPFLFFSRAVSDLVLNLNRRSMKIIFYRALLNDRNGLSANELIYYSFLVSKSIGLIGGVFDVDGNLNVDVLNEMVSDSPFQMMATYTIDEVSKYKGISKSSVSLCKRHLIDACMIKGELIKISPDIINSGYFPLLAMDKLKGELLIFYSFLKSVSANYKYIINLSKYNIAVNYGWSDKNLSIRQLIFRLKSMGMISKRNKIILEVL